MEVLKKYAYFILFVIAVVIGCVGCASSPYNKFEKSIVDGDYITAVEVYNQEIFDTEDQAKADEYLALHVDAKMLSYENGETTFEQVIADLQQLLEIENTVIVGRIDEFIYVNETIQTAERLYDDGMFEESFAILAIGLQDYPDNEKLSSTLVDFCDHYIITITQQVQKLCEEERYKEAINVLEEALEQYECDEFNYMLESTKEQKSKLYKLKNDIVAKVKTLTAGWTEEEFDVKQAANDTGAYIVKSGKKLMLGDYTEDDITVLSFTGNVVSSVAGVDLLFDLRDLSYDITHWGEEEYFVAYLAADVVALLPVIGVVKYFDHVKDATTVVESVADIGKNSDEVVDIVDTVADVGKKADKASEAVDATADAGKSADNIADAAKNIAKTGDAGKHTDDVAESSKKHFKNITKQFDIYPTINSNLVGKNHPKTGVPFVLKKIEYSDGRKLQLVVPKFTSFDDVQLKPKELYTASFDEQKEYCLKQLKKDINNPFSKVKKNFTEEQLDDIQNGIIPNGFTWHHNEKEGLMQLVDSEIHDKTGHTGGMSIWGQGHK